MKKTFIEAGLAGFFIGNWSISPVKASMLSINVYTLFNQQKCLLVTFTEETV